MDPIDYAASLMSERERVGDKSWKRITTEEGERIHGVFINVMLRQWGRIEGTHYRATQDPELLKNIIRALERKKQKRQRAAKKAVETRKIRDEFKVRELAKMLLEGKIHPSENCLKCGQSLEDEKSYMRGLGPECWQGILEVAQEIAPDCQHLLAKYH